MGTATYSAIGSPSDVQMLNSGQYNNALNMLGQNIGDYGTGYSGQLGQTNSLINQIAEKSGNYQNMISQLMGANGQGGLVGEMRQAGRSYDPEAGMRQWLAQVPEYQNVINRSAQNALSEYGETAQEYAKRVAGQSMSDIASQLGSAGLLGTGGGLAAITQAGITPQLEAAQNLAQMRSNYMQGVGGQLLSQGLSQAQGAYDTQQNALMQSILGRMQGVQTAGGLLGEQLSSLGSGASASAQTASTLASLLGNAQSTYAGMSEPQYWNPQYEATPGIGSNVGGALTGALGGAASGATLGSIVPGIGTTIGALIGAGVGGLGGWFA